MCMDVCTCVCNIQYIQIFTVIVIKFTYIENYSKLGKDHRYLSTLYNTKGVSTAEGGRGHVTAYTMCTPSKIGPDILNINRSATE